MRSDPRLRRWYAAFNRRYFKGALPPATVRWAKPSELVYRHRGRRRMAMGMTEADSGRFDIYLHPAMRRMKWWDAARLTLLHEMGHVATATEREAHGAEWRAEMKRLEGEGAFLPFL